FKRGDPVTTIFSLAGRLLSGEMYPVTVLPIWLQFVAAFLPMKYSLDALRLALLQDYSISQLSFELSMLLLFGFILVPSSVIFFNWAINRAKRDGSLSQY
ncbi:MAG: ABC transporter permease, partial [Anaerolineae bacterium]|nr:ABC transporter permease [Anaerolineae bacterium]